MGYTCACSTDMKGFFDDLRYGLRGLIKNRGFALAAVLSLALGIGANTTIFTLLNALFLRPLPVTIRPAWWRCITTDPRIPGASVSYPNYRTIATTTRCSLPCCSTCRVTVNLTGRGDPQLLMGQLVSANYFTTLGVNPVVGRGFRAEEDVPGASPVVVISYGIVAHSLRRHAGSHAADDRDQRPPLRHYRSGAGRLPGTQPDERSRRFPAVLGVPQRLPAPGPVAMRRALFLAVVGRLKPGSASARPKATCRACPRHWNANIRETTREGAPA